MSASVTAAIASEIPTETLNRLRYGIRLLALHELGESDSADEVAQETLVRVVRAWRAGQVRDPEKLGAFARGVARHVLLDSMRLRQREVSLAAAGPISDEGQSLDPLATIVSEEQLTAVRRALEILSPADRELLRLAYFEGLTSEEMSTRLCVPAARIRKRKERALDRLRNAFARSQGHTAALRTTERHGAQLLAGSPVSWKT